MSLTVDEVRERFLLFMKKKGHSIVPSAPITPEGDPTTLFTGSGMQPLLPYLLGSPHPQGVRIANSQRCLRAQDIEEVGDNRHTTFFEMLGNWSLGDYFKKEQINNLFFFLTDTDEGLGLDPSKLYITVFSGSDVYDIPQDDISVSQWQKCFKQIGIDATVAHIGTMEKGDARGIHAGERIFFYDATKNWWSRAGIPENMPLGEPGGGCSEVFYDFGEEHTDPAYSHLKPHPNSDSGRFVEITNSVFMEYVKTEKGFEPLPKKNVDFGAGLERLVAAVNNNPDIFMIDVFLPLRDMIGEKVFLKNPFSARIVSDHLRSSIHIIRDGVFPSNKDAGYVLRRLIRRATFHLSHILQSPHTLYDLAEPLLYAYSEMIPKEKHTMIRNCIEKEVLQFEKTLKKGVDEFEKIVKNKKSGESISPDDVFFLFSTYGFPFELTQELAEKKGLMVDEELFMKKKDEHRSVSKGMDEKFKGGLKDTSEASVKYHSATHLLYQVLIDVLGEHIISKGSNITPERLRFDFSHPKRLTDEEIDEIEKKVNELIEKDLPITHTDMPRTEAEALGAKCSSESSYGEVVRVYTIGDGYSREFCGGPHIASTKEIGTLKIVKQESIGQGIRRIKAVIHP